MKARGNRLFWSVSIAHLTVDSFNGTVPVVLAFLSGHLMPLTNIQIGFAISAYQMTAAISQPFCGWLADRSGGRWLGGGGVAWTVAMLALAMLAVTVTHSYPLLVLLLVLGAIGSGAFHPVGTMHAAASDDRHATGRLSVFFFMGQLGSAIGPAVAGFLLDQTATHNAVFTQALGPAFSGQLVERGSVMPLVLMAMFAVPGVMFMLLTVPSARAHRSSPAKASAAKRPFVLAPLLLLVLIIMLRGMLNPGLVSFLPRLFQERGWSASEYGLVASMYWIGGGVMGMVFGYLASRFGNRMLIAVSMLLAAPAVYGLGVLDGAIAFVLALAAGAFSGASHSLIIAMAQRLLPTGKGLASGMSLGLIFAMGAVGVLIIGALADTFGLTAAIQIVAAVGVITAFLSLLLPADRPADPVETMPAAEEALIV